MVIGKFLAEMKLFRIPEFMNTEPPDSLFPRTESEEVLYRRLLESQLTEELHGGFSSSGNFTDFELSEPPKYSFYRNNKNPKKYYTELFADALAHAVTAAVELAANAGIDSGAKAGSRRILSDSPAEKARRWFISSYPLLGALAASFMVIEDPDICIREEISIAAISEAAQTIFIHPGSGLSQDEYRFVMAHEFLHVGLRHQSRCQGRDHFLWNVACDYVINGWLVEMGVGAMPRHEVLYDPALTGLSAETVYDTVVIDTSGSMNRYMLSVALGSVASYAESRDVPYVRVIFCDAAAYDAGYIAPDAIMNTIQVRGRGGTILQPGIDFLIKAPDFPADGPILIITDAECDHFTCARNHAILIPKGTRLPFSPKCPVFVFE
jgi:hypothetical protein